MNDDDLRARLRALAPDAGSLDPVTSPRAQELLERTMTGTATGTPTGTTADRTPGPLASGGDGAASGRSRRPALLGAAAAVALALGGGVAWVAASDGGSGADQTRERRVTTLALAAEDPTMMSCLPLSAEFLRQLPLALAGTVVEVTDAEVRVDVERAYAGAPGDEVVLTRPPATDTALLGGADLPRGERVLISAGDDGTVVQCGFSGRATPELQAAYDEAFGG